MALMVKILPQIQEAMKDHLFMILLILLLNTFSPNDHILERFQAKIKVNRVYFKDYNK